ncbi:MAG: hypothetical protein RLZZ126_317 [Pseudomonadota bacterium]
MQSFDTAPVLRQWIAALSILLCTALFLLPAGAQTGEMMTVKRQTELRSGPSATDPVVGTLAAQSQVAHQAGRQGPWVEVKDAANRSGWAHMFDLAGASASGGGNIATNALRGISSLFGGGRSASAQTGTSTVGIRGLGAEDLARSQPNINAVLMMETMRVDAVQARGFASDARLQTETVEALPTPPPPMQPGGEGSRP